MEKGTPVFAGLTIGIDLGDRRSAVCVVDGEGAVRRRWTVATTEAGVCKGLANEPPSRVVIEVGTHSPWVSRVLEALGHEVIVANPRRVRLIAENDAKSDRVDAETLARLGRADPQLLHPIRHRGEQAQRDRAWLSVRDGLVRARVLLINQARGIAKAQGRRLPGCSTEGFARRMRREGLERQFPGLEAAVKAIEALGEQIRALDAGIEAVSTRDYPETRLLRQVAGVGPLTALSFVLTVEDPRRFRRSRPVGAYLGLRPRRRQSGASDPALRISKTGDPYTRRLLVQAAHYLLGPFGPDTDLRRFGERLIARGGRAARKKAIVAVARKLAVLLHRLWVTSEVYQPLRGSPLAAAA
jgi:transposase